MGLMKSASKAFGFLILHLELCSEVPGGFFDSLSSFFVTECMRGQPRF